MNDFGAGTRELTTGFGSIMRSPKMLLLGGVPALVTSLLVLSGLGVLAYYSGALADWMTPFAEQWAFWLRRAMRVVLALCLLGAAAFLGSISFIALTLLIGGPFYERIAEHTERQRGLDSGHDGAGTLRMLGRGLRDSVRLVITGVFGAVLLLLVGFIPIIGVVLAAIFGALFGGWLITLEVTGPVFQRLDMGVGARHRMLWRYRRSVFGFGIPTYLLCLVPVAQLVVIPSAVVGGTLLAHRVLSAERVADARDTADSWRP